MFKKVYGNSMLQYYQEKQMILAFSLLKNKGNSVKDIAQTLGYSNASNFTIAFKKVHNILPSEID